MVRQKYISYWKYVRDNFDKLQFYNSSKEEYTLSNYLELLRKVNERKTALVKRRLGSHKLIRICPNCKCNEIE